MEMMAWIFVLALLATKTWETAESAPPTAKRTIMANKVTLKDYPGIILLVVRHLDDEYYYNNYCSGTILDEYTVLTAAHCIVTYIKNDLFYYSFPFEVYAGVEQPFSGDKNRLHKKTFQNLISFIHPRHFWKDYDGSTLRKYDVAIIKLKVPWQFSDQLQPTKISLDEQYDFDKNQCQPLHILSFAIPNRTEVELTKNDDPGNMRINTLFTNATLNSMRFCEKCTFRGDIAHYFKGRSDIIEGDSGGALMEMHNGQPRQIGVTSSCVPSELLDVYTSTYRNRKFIKSRLGKGIGECGIPDYEDISNIADTVVTEQSRLDVQFVWLSPLTDARGRQKCLAIHISRSRLVTYDECFEDSLEMPTKIAGVYEMQLFPKQLSRMLDFNITVAKRRLYNGLVEFTTPTPLVQWLYTRPICTDVVDVDQTIHNHKIYAIGYGTYFSVFMIEQTLRTTLRHQNVVYLCTENKGTNKITQTKRFSLVVVMNQRFHLIGIGSPLNVSVDCPNAFRQYLYSGFK